jgi:hypothetical protein
MELSLLDGPRFGRRIGLAKLMDGRLSSRIVYLSQ